MTRMTSRQALCGALLALAGGISIASADVSHRVVEIHLDFGASLWIDVDENGEVDSLPGHYNVFAPPEFRLLGLFSPPEGEWHSGFLVDSVDLFPMSLNMGDSVGPVQPGGVSSYGLELTFYGSAASNSPFVMPVGKQFVGIEFQRAGAVHYGWLGIEVVDGSRSYPIDATLTEIAWESEPGTSIAVGWGDCNGNGLNDVVELLSGARLPDCNGDLVVDDCQPDSDCNGNGLRDLCELGTLGAPDCNGNLVPDGCEIAADPAIDCDGDGAIDACLGPLADCDGNGVHDPCQGIPASEDCDGNGLFDWCESSVDPSLDCDGDGVFDACAIAAGLVEDCDGNGTPDGCQGTPFAANPSGLFLRGGARAVVPGFGSEIPTSEITIELWQWAESMGSVNPFHTSFDEFNRCVLHAPFHDGTVRWEFGQDPAANGRLSYAPPESILGSWQHFSLQASNAGDFMRIYRNGVLEAEKVGAETFELNSDSFTIGGEGWDGFEGRIDELRVWDHVRTAEQVLQGMNGTVDPATPGLVGYWRFDEGSGSLSKDLAGTRDAILSWGAQWALRLDCPPSPDLNGDGIVNGGDLGMLLAAWGALPPGSPADLTADGVVDGADLGVLLSQWG